MILSEAQVRRIALITVRKSRPAMRVAIGDRTPAQYDRADRMAEAIANAVVAALKEVGLTELTRDEIESL